VKPGPTSNSRSATPAAAWTRRPRRGSSSHSSPPRRRAREPAWGSPRCTASSSRAAATSGSTASPAGNHVQDLSAARSGVPTKVTSSRLAAITTAPTGTETILVVEDEEAIRGIAKRILGEAGYTVLTAATASDALLTRASAPGQDPPVADRRRDAADGRKGAGRAPGLLRPGIKVLYMSGYTDDAIVHHGTLDPGTHFIAKPFSATGSDEKVREVSTVALRIPARATSHQSRATTDEGANARSICFASAASRIVTKLRQRVIAARYDEIVLLSKPSGTPSRT
jgi:CheY-like chemotaxis protein